MRTKIGHLGTWACVNYGNGIFPAILPGERHNYLACGLSRHREDGPFVAERRKKLAGKDVPSLGPESEGEFEGAEPTSDDEVDFKGTRP